MGVAREKQRDIVETGTEPDFQINDITRYEDAGDGMIRVYVASHRGRNDRIEYSFHCSPQTLARLGRACEVIAAEFLEILQFRRSLSNH